MTGDEPELSVVAEGSEQADLIFFNGTVMRGEPAHSNLAGTKFVEETTTALKFRLFSINNEYPAMVKATGEDGVSIEGELYLVPREVWPRVLEAEPPGLSREQIELFDGRLVYGIVGSEHLVSEKGHDISEFGGWRHFLRHLGSIESSGV